jgi:hypothetical protein
MADASERSLGGEQTWGGAAKPQRSEVSLSDERTLGDGLSGQDTIIDDIEVVDLKARYKIEGTLGQGGMGAVLLATDTRLDRQVAIKRILGEKAGDRMAVNRFLTEAKSIAALNHPNIVQIYDYGRAKDGPFLIMEYVDGGSLLDRCRDGAMPLEDAVDLACQLCDGLAKAHDLGIIHRDIKPANVLLTKDGAPKLTDFGLAKAQTGDHGQTMTGAVLGTPDFMPPEQRRDASLVDHRSDLWSLAATAYQMVTGRSPKIIRFNNVPAALQDVLGKALEEDKDLRYQSVHELRDALKASLPSTATKIFELEAGQCSGCGTANDPSRKFCRKCGGSLLAPCLSCSQPIPMWEEICGECGAKQTPLVEAKRTDMVALQARADGLLGDLEFERAAEAATTLRDEPNARLAFLKSWADEFLAKVRQTEEQQFTRASESLAQAIKHEQAYDYAAAFNVLNAVPLPLRRTLFLGHAEIVETALARVSAKRGECLRLETTIKDRIGRKDFANLESDVDKLLALEPKRTDLHRIQSQLAMQKQKLIKKRDTLVAEAQSHLETYSYAAALNTLMGVSPSVITPEIVTMKRQCEINLHRSEMLHAKITKAVASQSFDGLLGDVLEYLSLIPNDSDFISIKDRCLAHNKRASDELAAIAQLRSSLENAARWSYSHETNNRRDTPYDSEKTELRNTLIVWLSLTVVILLTPLILWGCGELDRRSQQNFIEWQERSQGKEALRPPTQE